jgi:hypothetical protein
MNYKCLVLAHKFLLKLQNSRLEVINISRNINCCSRRSVEALKAALAVNRSLKALILEHVGLVSETAVILGESLSRNSSLEALIITGNDAALNPLRTDLLNFEQNVKAYGQKAFRSVAQGLNKAFQSIQQTFDDPVGVRREAQAPPMTKSLPTAVELTRSAVIAFVTSMRVNHTLTSLKILVPDDSIALNRVAPGSKLYEFRQLFGELNDLIKRNQESKPAPNESNPLGERPSDAFALE